jgi:uncharacterized protein (TIGR02996 family)
MTSDDPFVAALAEDPADEALRLIYADWLEERDDPRAEYLRLDAEYQDLAAKAKLAKPERARRTQLKRTLKRLRKGLDPAWLAVVSRPRIERCVAFRFQCPQRWDQLQATDDPLVRRCDECEKNVHYCGTIEEAQKHAQAGRCVAVSETLTRHQGDIRPRRVPLHTGRVLLGKVRPTGIRRRRDNDLAE